MPAKSRAQQRLMQAAEHGANFPMARKLRQSMTHQQLHDFSVGSEKNKPQHVSSSMRKMHPAMRAQAAHVVDAHRHLSKHIPGFNKLPMRHQMQAHQEFIRTKKANGY